MSDNVTGQWLPLESGDRWQRLRRRIPVGVVVMTSLLAALALLAMWHARSSSTTVIIAGISFLLVASATSAAFAMRHTAVWVSFSREQVKIGSRVMRFHDVRGAQQRSCGQFQSPTVLLMIYTGRGRPGTVYLRFAGESVTDGGCRNRLVALIERSNLPRSIIEVVPGFAESLPGTPITLSKMSALALILREPTLIETRYGPAG